MRLGEFDIVVGMMVYSAAAVPMGTVEAVDETGIVVNGQRVGKEGILRTDTSSVFLSGTGMAQYEEEKQAAPSAILETAEIRTAQNDNASTPPAQVQPGVEVVGLDEKHVGTVKAVQDNTILVGRPLKRDIYVPFDDVLDASDTRVVLNMKAHEVDHRHWPEPDLHTGLGR